MTAEGGLSEKKEMKTENKYQDSHIQRNSMAQLRRYFRNVEVQTRLAKLFHDAL